MARGLALGWGRPILATDPRTAVAKALVAELGGERGRGFGDHVDRGLLVAAGAGRAG